MFIRNILKSYYNSTEVQGMGDAIVQAMGAAELKDQIIFQTLLDRLKKSLFALDQSRNHSNHNSHTQALEQADLSRDLAFRALWGFIEACALRQNSTYQTAAQAILNHLKPFDKSLYAYGYGKQNIALKDFIVLLDKTELQTLLVTLQAKGWFEELKQAQENFLQIYEYRTHEETQKQNLIPAKEAREQVLNYLAALTQTMNAVSMGQQEAQQQIYMKIDQIIEDYEVKARSRRAKKDVNNEELN